MGQSGTFTGGINGNHYRLRVDWEAEQNISGNYSTVICHMYLEQDRYYSLNIGSRSSTTTIDGVGLNYSSAAINNDGGTTVSLGTVSRTVPHESDGTKTISISSNFYINATIKGVKYTYIYADSGSITLNTIPRKSAVSCPAEVNVDSSLPITISPHSSAFRHTLTYQLAGGNVQSIGTQLGGGVHSWSTAGLARQMPETAKKTCTITCITYSGSTEIGRETASCQMIVPDNASYKPVLKDTDIKISDAAGYHTTYGSYVQGKSRLRIVLSAAGKEGSPIRSGTVTVGETTLNGLDVTTPPLSERGNVAVKATVTDGRGHPSAEASRTITVLPYSAPYVSRPSVERCDDAGIANDEGGYAMIRFDYSFSNLNNRNKGYITIKKKEEGIDDWENADEVVSNEPLPEYAGRYELAKPQYCDADKAFDIQVSIRDDVTEKEFPQEAMLPTAKTVFDILADGTGIAFGKVASKPNTLESAWDADVAGLSMDTIKSNMMPDLDATYDIGSSSARYSNIHVIQARLNGLEMCGNIVPNTTGTRNLGSSSYRWNYVYGKYGNFANSITVNGNAIIASGSSTNGRYVKFYDGTMICWGIQDFGTQNISAPWGSMYESTSYMSFSNFPSTFTDIPVVIISPAQGSSNAFYVEAVCNESASNPGSFYATRPGSATGCKIIASYIAIGRWK